MAVLIKLNYLTDNSKPTLMNLCEKVTPYFATYWWRIGVFLNIHHGELASIEHDFRSCQERCDRMLAKWLDVDTTASWEKLKLSIKLATEDRTGTKLASYVNLHVR